MPPSAGMPGPSATVDTTGPQPFSDTAPLTVPASDFGLLAPPAPARPGARVDERAQEVPSTGPQPLAAPAVEIADLSFSWPRRETPVLDIAELTLAAGRTLFLQGASGTGKSTLLALIAGVLLPGRGRCCVLGQNWADLPGARRDAYRADHVGVLFQQFNLLPYLSVVENVLLPCRFSRARAERAGWTREGTAAEAARQLLERVGIGRRDWGRPAVELSVGQQQRVAAARALIGSPELVIADEPTSALDADLREQFMDLLLDQCRAAGSTLIFVSHDERLADRFDERIVLADINRAAPAAPAPRRAARPKRPAPRTSR
jgi:putative ABC transport system ATP-binding protein